jgi:hypothetical protein
MPAGTGYKNFYPLGFRLFSHKLFIVFKKKTQPKKQDKVGKLRV